MASNIYSKLYGAWKEAFPELTGSEVQRAVNAFWKEKKKDNIDEVLKRTSELQQEYRRSKKKQPKISSFVRQGSGAIQDEQVQPIRSSLVQCNEVQTADPREVDLVDADDADVVLVAPRKAPAQEKLMDEINVVNNNMSRLIVLKNNGFASVDDNVQMKKLKQKEKELEAKLKRLRNLASSSKKFRLEQKRKQKEIIQRFPQLATEISSSSGLRPGSGRPRVEDSQPLLLKTIVDIVAPEACTESRRRSELLYSCKSLDDLQRELDLRGFQISRSALYLRLLPQNYTTIEGRRHVKTVPVRLTKAQNSGKNAHQDGHFAAATNLHLRNLAEIMGNDSCLVLSQDDKARVLMGLPAANKQSPILMHLDYKVTLPDHDWVVAPGHKLIPSVYAGLAFENYKLTYSGPTYIAIRSGKHDSSTAFSHACDFRRIIELESFRTISSVPGSGVVKPIVIVFTDGGPDENPRFPKTLLEYARHFKSYDLDAIFVACHAPGQSAYNQVERRMAPLSRDLSGVILPHGHYGSHLDCSGKTMDKELELRNFQKAGEALADVWSTNIINGFPTVCEYIPPGHYDGRFETTDWLTQSWLTKHVRQSQYFLQIVRCEDRLCCTPWRSNLNNVVASRFLPAPALFKRESCGVKLCNPNDKDGHFGDLPLRVMLNAVDPSLQRMAYDFYCPSIQGYLGTQTCNICNHYFVSKAAFESHQKAVHRSSELSIMESIESVVQAYSIDLSTASVPEDPTYAPMQIIEDVAAWNQSEFTETFELVL